MKTDPVEEFLEGFDKPSTKRIYGTHLKSFFDFIDIKPTKYFNNGRNYDDDLIKFWRSMPNIAPCTRACRITTVKNFLEENDIFINRKTWNRIKRQKKSIPQLKDHVPTVSELKKILLHAGVKERALFLALASSGMRIGEALKINIEDIELKTNTGELRNPGKITIRQDISKNDTPRITFVSDEARDVLLEWLRIRDQYLKEACENVKTLHLINKDPNDPRVFPFSWSTAWWMWSNLLKKSGYDRKAPGTNRLLIHIHTLRKFMMNRLKGVIRIDAVETLVGHEGYLSKAYVDISEEELQEEYMKGMHTVSIFEKASDLSEVNESLKQKDEQIKELESRLNKMQQQLTILTAEKTKELHEIINNKK